MLRPRPHRAVYRAKRRACTHAHTHTRARACTQTQTHTTQTDARVSAQSRAHTPNFIPSNTTNIGRRTRVALLAAAVQGDQLCKVTRCGQSLWRHSMQLSGKGDRGPQGEGTECGEDP